MVVYGTCGDLGTGTGGKDDGSLGPSPSSNGSGDVAFQANGILGEEFFPGIFVDSGGTDTLVALRGDTAPGTGGGTYFSFVFPRINASGDVVFSATFTGGSGVFLAAGGALTAILDLADSVPGQPGATFFAVGSVSVTASGHVAFTARYSGGVGDEGLYLHDGTDLVRVIDESDASLGLTMTNLHMLTTTGSSGGADGKPNALNSSDSIASDIVRIVSSVSNCTSCEKYSLPSCGSSGFWLRSCSTISVRKSC